MDSFNDKDSKENKYSDEHIPEPPFPAYQGDEPYIFISYSHDDSDLVYQEIDRFHNDGYKIWYDEGIISGERWHEVVERALIRSSLVIFFITDNAVESLNVRNEISLAFKKNIPVFPIFLKETELKYGLELSLSSSPPIFKYEMSEMKYISKYRQKFEKHGFLLNETHSNIEKRIDNPPFPAYQGDDPYIFISYSHADSDLVFPEIKRFHDDKCNIWYDEGIPSGERWEEEVENALKNSKLFIVFISRNSVASANVRNEISLAIKKRIDIMPIYLEATNLEGHGLELQITSIQSIYKHKMTEEGYIKKYRKELKNHGFKLQETSTSESNKIRKDDKEESETEQFICLIEEKISASDEEIKDDFSEIKDLYDDAVKDQNEDLLEFVKEELKLIFERIYLNEYFKLIENGPKRLPYPSLKFKIPRPIRHYIIQSAFSKLEKSSFYNQNLTDELIRQGQIQKKENDMKGLEKTVVQLYRESKILPEDKEFNDTGEKAIQQNNIEKSKNSSPEIIHDTEEKAIQQNNIKSESISSEINYDTEEKAIQQNNNEKTNSSSEINYDTEEKAIQQNNNEKTNSSSKIIYDSEILNEFEKLNTTTNTIYDLGKYKVLVILNDGTNLTDWNDVENKNDILYISEDLSDYKDLTGKYNNLKSLKAIVSTKVNSDVTNMKDMFSGCSSLSDISDLENWNTSKVTDMNGMFKGCSLLKDISPLKNWNTNNVADMNGMFDGCTLLEDISPLKNWKTDNLADISGMFYSCSSLIDTNPLKNWNTENLKFMSRVFRGCTSLTDVSALKNWKLTNISDMTAIFKGCRSLIDIFSLKNWNVNNIADLSEVFYDCSSLENILPLKNWKTKNVLDMSGMFNGCSSLEDTSALKDWKTGNVIDMSGMFENCSSLVDIFSLKNWNAKKLKDTSQMFRNCTSLEDATALDNWSTDKIMYKNEMFDGCTNLKKLPKWYKS